MKRRFLYAALVAVFALSSSTVAQPEVDTSFGKLTFNAGHAGSAKDIIVQPDNKIVMISSCFHFEDGFYTVCMVRVNPNGSMDSSFVGSENRVPGIVRTKNLAVCNCGGDMFGIAQQTDGKLVVVGVLNPAGVGQSLGIARYNTDGSIDTSFGTNGSVFNNISPESDHGREVLIQPDGKIVVVGYSFTGSAPFTTSQQFVARFTSAGIPDPTFGTGGVFRATIPGNSLSNGESIAIQSDGKILAGGYTSGAANGYLITRLNSDGTPDLTWDTDGYKILPQASAGIFYDDGIVSIVAQPDGKITALGTRNHLYRMNADSSPDLNFGFSGSRTTFPPSYNAENSYDMMITAGERITVVGQSDASGVVGYRYEVGRYLSTGAEDWSFSEDGYLGIELTSGNDGAKSVAVDSLGRVVVAGISAQQACGLCNPWVPSSFSVTRLIMPAVAIGISGRVMTPEGRPIMNAILTTVDSGGNTRVARSNPFGYYRFLDLPAGPGYTIIARAKSRTFVERFVSAGSDVVNFDFISEQ